MDYGSDESKWPPVVEEIKQYLKEFDYSNSTSIWTQRERDVLKLQ